ncbi:MAG: DNA repair protein RecO [Actinobacteria bacterium]|nr:DNA repair protein RecO [Actinomycetota bacterium]
MGIPKLYKTEAIILKGMDLGEADRLLTVYTPNYGKMRVVAKGVRRAKSKVAGHVETLSHCVMMLSRGRNLDIISQAQNLDAFLPLRDDLDRMSFAIYAAELVERFTAEHQESYPVFRLLLETLKRLSEASATDLPLRYFEVKLLDSLGYRPELRHCVSCRQELEPVQNFFSASGGGAICPACHSDEIVFRALSVDALKVLRFIQDNDYCEVARLRLRPRLARELEYLLREYIRYLLERDVRSVAFMDSLRKKTG